VATAAACASLVVVGLETIFLVNGARPALRKSGIRHFFTDSVWNPLVGHFGVYGLLMGSIIIATIALLVAAPLGLGMALFINEYSPRALRQPMTSVIDLLAALPSLLFGIWGFFVLQSKHVGVARWLANHLSLIPFFRLSSRDVTLSQSSFLAGIVVGIMALPIITSVSRDVMAQVPREQCEGALALGGTRWGMIRDVILPFGRGGIVASILLGFGRAVGETIAVALIIVPVFKVNTHVLQSGAGSIAALIATRFSEAGSLERSALVAAGLALFIFTLLVNLLARRIVAKSRLG
jgi:phosphate transport system permease protein